MQQNTASEEIVPITWNAKSHYRVNEIKLRVPVLRQTNPVYAIIFPSMSSSSKW